MDRSHFNDVVERENQATEGGVPANRNLRSEAGRKGSGQSCRNDRVMREERGRGELSPTGGVCLGQEGDLTLTLTCEEGGKDGFV